MVGLVSRVPVITSVHIANNDNIYRRLAHRRNRLVAVSDFVRGMLHGRGVPDRFIDTVYNGTDLLGYSVTDPLTTRQKFGISADSEVVGIVGRVCREKGHLEMVRALKHVLVERPNAHLMLVGRVVPSFESEFQEEIRIQGVGHAITMTGERHDVPALIDSVELTAMPSYMETFGIAALEAMARGKPVVATRVGGLPEVVRDGQTGLLVDLEVKEIAAAVVELLQDEQKRLRMGARGREIVEEHFTVERMVSRFESVYRKSIG